ncbi:MAG: cbb3-type cytochrome c oxidase subunit I [Bacteroidetes bacterium]|nr:cbb3-type cytochrome c oxidase subunit I [Bacteroidota bacterium]
MEERYDSWPVKAYTYSMIIWGLASLLYGVVISLQMVYPGLNFGEYFSYGRMRPIHTNGGAFGFGLSGIFALSYYMVPRLAKAPLFLPQLAKINFWLYNLTIAAAVITLHLGFNTTKEYAELEWPIDILVVLFWVFFAVNMLGTIFMKTVDKMYVSLWYVIATILGVAVLYIFNNLAVPASLFKSYSLYAGVNDANVQWWYGHNAVAFVFTTPILAIFFYFFPKVTNLPLYSHRLSIVAFWSLVFMYLWTGAHHLIWTPVPDWLQTVAIAFSLMLIAPSWGSVINGYMTMGNNWEQMKTNYLAKFFILGITFYGLQTLQGPSQAIRSISSLIHYTDWVPGHVHMGTMGWFAMTIMASFYYVIPKIYKTDLYSIKLANTHFWLVFTGQIIYSISMWIAGIMQGAMWKATNPDGSLKYTFQDSITASYVYWDIRAIGGVIFLAGAIIFAYNIFKTIQKGSNASSTPSLKTEGAV